jgi:hypothetical protein
MLKTLSIIFIAAVFILSASSCAGYDSGKAEEAKNAVITFFEESENRKFDIYYPIKIENRDYYEIIVSGILKDGKEYRINAFEVNPDTGEKFFYNKETQRYQRFYNVPRFACKTSYDGKKRIESIGMNEDGPSGLHALTEMRIIDLQTGGVLWRDTANLNNKFIWSENNRFVSAENSGRQWTQTVIIDTATFETINLPDANDILKAEPGCSPPNPNAPVISFKAQGWDAQETVTISFEWLTEKDTVVTGKYAFDAVKKTRDIYEIEEINRG